MTSKLAPVVLVLGSGANIGSNVARTFAAKGYKVAVASRRLKDEKSEEGYLNINLDLSEPKSMTAAFSKVKQAFGLPSVVVYNAASAKFVPATSPLDLSIEDFQHDFAVNCTSVLAAAKEAVASFRELPSEGKKTFIFTGNILNTEPIVPLLSNGLGKSATAHLMQVAAMAYEKDGYRFYYADERKEDGTVAGGKISGPAHGEFYYELAEGERQGPWLATFVAGKGYTAFPGTGYVKDPNS